MFNTISLKNDFNRWFNIEIIFTDKSDIRKYGGTSQAEFFAVVAEYCFECQRLDLLESKHPELFKMMEMCFRVGRFSIVVERNFSGLYLCQNFIIFTEIQVLEYFLLVEFI
ncbi:zinc-dependent peptidase [Flavobacterium sp. Sd200]|uniref:zinc-dependent peptidase n=1 Tax=Flavobacterium sp. Sd200 TaxID=2692211 RepID=UPI00351B15E6